MLYMEITDRQQLIKFLPAAFMATLQAKLSFKWKYEALPPSPEDFIVIKLNLFRME